MAKFKFKEFAPIVFFHSNLVQIFDHFLFSVLLQTVPCVTLEMWLLLRYLFRKNIMAKYNLTKEKKDWTCSRKFYDL